MSNRRWRHITLSAYGAWLPGDERGFRSRRHRIHSSGDYRNPPPPLEHAGLRRHNISRAIEPTRLPREGLGVIGNAIVENLRQHASRLASVAVTPTHVHILVELPDSVSVIRKTLGWCKYFSSRALRRQFPQYRETTIWAEGESYPTVDDEGHFLNTRRYLMTKQGADAWTWCDQKVGWD